MMTMRMGISVGLEIPGNRTEIKLIVEMAVGEETKNQCRPSWKLE